MKSLNSIFLEDTKEHTRSTRQVRSDKKMTVKFPVREEVNAKIRMYVHQHQRKTRDMKMTVTVYCSQMVERALQQYRIRPDMFIEIPYKDTTIYKTIKLNRPIYEELFAISCERNCSVRETAYQLFMNVFEQGVN